MGPARSQSSQQADDLTSILIPDGDTKSYAFQPLSICAGQPMAFATMNSASAPRSVLPTMSEKWPTARTQPHLVPVEPVRVRRQLSALATIKHHAAQPGLARWQIPEIYTLREAINSISHL